ncbi:MAG: YtrH family sporulation protein [Firmicutes bacterium]|nr:YtrH family sporulation protein [Bacillota bacterium]
MIKLLQNLLFNFTIALGVMLGGSLFGALAALLTGGQPLKTMVSLSERLKIWAIVVALGGTFSSFEILDLGILKGEFRVVTKQVLYILSSFLGAHIGYLIIFLIEKRGRL